MDKNEAKVIGKIVSDFEYSHEVFGERFYIFKLEIPRLSENRDEISIMVSERLINVRNDMTGKFVVVEGDMRSYNYQEGEVSRLLVYIFVKDIWFCKEEDIHTKENNQIIFEGTICKPTTYRKTPAGFEVSDVFIAINSRYKKSSYIPCIAWGRNARYSSCLPVGKRISICGRFQSRIYLKDGQYKIAYEVSIGNFSIL